MERVILKDVKTSNFISICTGNNEEFYNNELILSYLSIQEKNIYNNIKNLKRKKIFIR